MGISELNFKSEFNLKLSGLYPGPIVPLHQMAKPLEKQQKQPGDWASLIYGWFMTDYVLLQTQALSPHGLLLFFSLGQDLPLGPESRDDP